MVTLRTLANAGMVPVRKGQPHPLHPAGSNQVGPGAALLETPDGGVGVCGMITSFWDDGDHVGTLAVVKAGTATHDDVCSAFEIVTTRSRAGSISSTTMASSGSPPTSANRRGLQARRHPGGVHTGECAPKDPAWLRSSTPPESPTVCRSFFVRFPAQPILTDIIIFSRVLYLVKIFGLSLWWRSIRSAK